MLLKAIKNSFATLVIAEHNGKSLNKNSLKLLTAASKLKDQTHILVFGSQSSSVAKSINETIPAQYVSKIITSNIPHSLSDIAGSIVKSLIQKNAYTNIVGIGSSFGKDLIPRLAGNYKAQPITDIIQVIDQTTFVRPTYAGNALTKVKTTQKLNFLTFRASSFEEVKAGNNSATIQTAQFSGNGLSQFVKQQKQMSERPDLSAARIVVSGGRGIKSKQNFSLIYGLAQAFGDAAVGASRAAVDSGYCPNQMQVGQTGKVVAPQLYIAVGISGAVQHLAGMKDSKVIVAINNRPDQPIFEVANYGLQADLFKVIPQITQKIKAIRSG